MSKLTSIKLKWTLLKNAHKKNEKVPTPKVNVTIVLNLERHFKHKLRHFDTKSFPITLTLTKKSKKKYFQFHDTFKNHNSNHTTKALQ